ncbi:hypothetical protein AK812_SmicGene11683 [Symbiodinium microadriaticum]|uniref:Golgi apparatus membrane protein TVP15 n=1 Tax=Symbiodinium microadriaticum TaxID=2951 RepID=A0A1Q9ECK3_SYMMI|nr:hypothetical protein AK812_SmicGene11683 [Symbiodinium microadriaticum]
MMNDDLKDASTGSVSLSPGGTAEMTSVAGPTAAQAAQQGPQRFQQQVATEMASQAVQGAGRVIRSTANEVILYIESNHYSVTALSFIGGMVLAGISALSLLNVFGFLSGPLSYVMQAYELLFGLVICIVDGPADRFPGLRKQVVSYAAFLRTNASRSVFYLFIACLEGQHENFGLRTAIGFYFAGIAVGHMVLAVRRPPQEVQQAELGQQLSPQQTV